MLRKRIEYLFSKNLKAIARNFLISLGTIWLIIEFVSFFDNDLIKKDNLLFYSAIGVSLTWSLIQSFPIIRARKKSKLSSVEIDIQINSLYDIKDCDISTPINDCFEASSEKTVQAGLIQREFNNDSDSFYKLLDEYFSNNEINGVEDKNKKYGRIKRYPYGTTAIIKSKNRNIYFTSMAEMTIEGFSKGTKESIWLGLCGLWNTVRKKGQLNPIALPIWGSGQSRTKASKIGLIQLIILSFVIATNESKVSNKLIISILEEDYDPDMFAEIKNFLNSIEF